MLRLALGLCLLLALVAAPAANAASTTQILRDCADDGVLQGNYSPSELRRARQNIPTDTDEYTDCRDVLARAAVAGVAGRGGGSGSSGSSGGFGPGATGGDGGAPADPDSPEGRQIVGEAGRQNLDRDGPIEPGVAGFINLAHAARAERRLNFVRTETRSGTQSHAEPRCTSGLT